MLVAAAVAVAVAVAGASLRCCRLCPAFACRHSHVVGTALARAGSGLLSAFAAGIVPLIASGAVSPSAALPAVRPRESGVDLAPDARHLDPDLLWIVPFARHLAPRHRASVRTRNLRLYLVYCIAHLFFSYPSFAW